MLIKCCNDGCSMMIANWFPCFPPEVVVSYSYAEVDFLESSGEAGLVKG